MSRRNVEDLYPLSPLQQGLLFHSIDAPGSGLYVEQLSCTLHGEVDLNAFERSWQQTVDRHPVLRTAFIWEGLAEPVQVVRRRVNLPFTRADWRGLAATEQEENLRAYLKADLQQGFDLSKAPLLRIALLRLSDDSYKFVWSYHHLMLDGWSIPLLLNEVFAFHEGFTKGQSLSLDRPRPYRDYIAWLQQQDISRAEAFWRQTLKGFTSPTPLRVDKTFQRAAGEVDQKGEQQKGEQQDGYRDQQLSIPEEIISALLSVTRRHQLTLNTLVQGAWAILLSRYSGEQDVVFGVTVAGRPAELSGVESMIGLFINTLPVRVKVDRGQAVAAWLKQLQVQQSELRQYEYSPLVQVQRWSQVPPGLPLFDSLLVFENYPVDASFRQQLEQLSISDVQKVERTNYPLTLLALPGVELSLRISYDSYSFDDAAIKRMLGHLRTMLEGIADNPSQRVADLPLLTSAEERQLIEWNRTGKDYPQQLCLHELFEAQVERTPDAVALVFEGEHVSYRKLNERANQLARRLRASGVRAETRVGICVERSLEMVIGLLGILKAGGAYVPLEPTYPAERLAFMLEDAQIKLLLTQERLKGALPAYRGEVIFLDRDREATEGPNSENVRSDVTWVTLVTPQNAVYVIYTSGSTGRPKGVVNTHRGICNRLMWMQDEYGLTREDRVLQKTPFSFDVSLWEFFWPLAVGARLVIARPGGHQDSAYLVKLITAEEITTLHFVPSMLQAFLSEPGLEQCRTLRYVMCSGEALSKDLQQRFYAQLPGQLHNLYGPTEAAVDVSYWACERAGVRRTVPIGRPIANTQLYILNDDLQPVPIGVAGELYIAGIGLARGYLDRPELTAEKFIANPFSLDPGTRLYRTGDQARFLEGGEIEFLGRLDQQVKLRGFRIELEEIEAVLDEHPTVRECAVVVRDDTTADRRIVAYVVAVAETVPSASALRSLLKVKLPEHMVPSDFVWLDTLPLTPNGKLDRRALPAPERAKATEEGSIVDLARNPLEEVVRGIWADVLRLEDVSLHDNFFELGGHSILALQVISRLRTILQIEVPVRELFETPTVAGFSERIERLRRTELGLPLPSLSAISRERELRPSFAQQRLWFLDQLEPESTAYNIPAAVRLRGTLNTRALEESFNEVMRRHEVLRTSFATVDGRPVQRIAPELRLARQVEDVRQVAGEQRDAFIKAIASEEAGRAFSLEEPPLLRLRVLRVDEAEHVLLLTMHHIISDGWSLGVLIREVAILYEAFSNNQPSPLAELNIQYADFAEWQREWLEGEVLERQLAYWKQQLDGSPARLQLPSSLEQSKRLQSPPSVTAKQQFALSGQLSKSLKRLSRREDATLFMTLLAAFQTLLHRYTGEDDINVGTAVANRNHDEIERLIGFFVNTLVLRTDLSGNPAFAKLLKRVREVCLGAYAHQDMPFEKLVEELQPERDQSHSPLFQVMFVLQNALLPALELTGLTFSPVAIEKSGAQFDLTLSMEETGNGLTGLWEYNTNLFDAPAITRLMAHFQNLLEAIASDPSQKLSELPILTADERGQLLFEWNDTSLEYQCDSCLHELFEQQVEQTPETRALSFVAEDGRVLSLTYRELNRRANQLARYLLRLGVGAETLVGILSERSPEMLVGVLGVFKAGAAYLPLDPGYPGERLSYMIGDARPRVLLVQKRHAGRIPLDRAAEVVYLDDLLEVLADESAENLPRRATPENLAYVIYTSGSTGTPKGVMVSHRGLANLSLAEALAFNLKAESKVLQFASWSFDASVFEMVMTLTAGATLCLAPAGAEFSGETLTRFLQDQEINTIALTPTTLAAVPLADLPDLQTIITGGEPCPAELVARWANGRRFFNVYGPTETTTWATFAACCDDGSTPNIGRPIANTGIYILDASLQLVPLGVTGQLHIGGVALARGYLNRPELTAEKFIPNPFSTERGARLYCTGDTARYREGGAIEFVGRTDGQVKLRGFRIELGEIEATLAEHEAARECAVILREDAPGEPRIVAYVLLAGDGNAATTEEWRDWRGFLKEKLPSYMIPAAFVVLEAWPLTPNGKLDRRALPAPGAPLVAEAGSASPAHSPMEEMLVSIWADLLRLERVGTHDNFFDLGGHSLLATQLVSRVREVFKVELPLRDFFAAPTVAELAARVASLSGTEQGVEMTPIVSVARDGELPLSFAQQRLWFLDQFEPGSPFYNVPSAVLLSGTLDVAALTQGINEVVRRHEILRTTFRSTHGQPRQVVSPVLQLTLPVENLQNLSEIERRAEVQRLAAREAQSSFDLVAGPLVRARLLQLAEREHVLLFTMHHIVSDGWSINVLVREVAALYEAHTQAKPSPLPELSIQYADFAAWQREWLSGKQIEAQLSYWREQLRDVPALLDLPTDHPRPPLQTYHGATARFTLTKSLSDELQRLSRREGVTLFMTLLAAFEVLLHRYSGADDVVVGTPMAGQNRTELEPLIGFFVNTLVLRTTFRDDPPFVGLLERVREVCLGAYAHQDLPFEKLVEELQPTREMSHSPLFQVMFTLQNAMAGARLPGLELAPLEVESEVAKFDLTLGMSERENGLAGVFEYNTDLFEAESIERMISRLSTLLEGIIANPERRVSELPLMNEQERRLIVEEWNATQCEYGPDESVPEIFERQAQATPDAVALVCEGKEWNYEEINKRANQLAHYLRSRDVGAEQVVGVLMERSAEMVIGLLGVLKAGGAYLPLDSSYPEERLAFILADARVSLLLTEERLLKTIPENAAPVVSVDAERDAIARESGENLPSGVSADNLVYVIYTSGSTGKPKGVCVPHRALVNHGRAIAEHYHLQATDRVLQFASLSFDVAAEELFASWAQGATVVLMPPDNYLLQTFLNFIEEQRISVVNLPASYWHEWVAALSRGEKVLPSNLRLVVTGSEKVSLAQLATWQKLVGDSTGWLNAYGPTETTITTTLFEPVGQLKNQGVSSVPIGRPINNATVYVLDKSLQPVPAGIAGELHIGGLGVARGYLNRPELTAEKFIPDPFSAKGGARLYRTGDWARYLPDSNIEFLRRIDHQVKVRGFRIELGEIEAALAEHANVVETAVVVREDEPDDKRIVAYIVSDRPNRPKLEATAEKSPPELWPSVGEYQVYDELMYLAMTNDERRTGSYREAINRLVKDKTVVEVGTGGDAILARLCVAAGAKKVYAIEALEEARVAAEALVKSLGLSDKITLTGGYSFDVQLPEKVDVCVSELIGTIGGSEGTAAILNDARRFLKEDGVMIPHSCVTKISAVQLPGELLESPHFTELSGRYAERIFEQVGFRFDVRVCLKNFPHENLLSDAGVFEELDFNGYSETAGNREIVLNIARKGTLNGFLLWLNLRAAEDIVIDNLEAEDNWLPVYFPVFHPGVEVSEGDIIKAVCSSSLSDNGVNPDYKITGALTRQDGEVINFAHSSPHHEPGYQQTDFYRRLFSPDTTQPRRIEAAKLSAKNLRAYLSERLPDYMLPSAFVFLDEMPRTAGGKVDRRALPAPEAPERSTDFTLPRSPIEEMLAGIFGEVLKVEHVGIDDNFFELGGHSLLATRVIARARELFQVEVPLRALFESPSVAGLAERVESLSLAVADSPTVPLRRVPRDGGGEGDGELPLSFIQQRFWFLNQLMPESSAYNIPTAVRLKGSLDREALERSFNEILRRHEILRTTFTAIEGRPAQRIAETLQVALPLIDLRERPENEREAEARRIVHEEAQQPFDLSRGPLLRTVLLQLDDDEFILVFTMHHIVSDGWSAGVLVRDLTTIYDAFSAGEPSPLPELPIQFADFAHWQREWLQGDALESRLAYWRKQFGGGLPVLNLPTDKSRPPVPTDHGANRSVVLSKHLSAGVKSLSQQKSVTLFMLLLAVFKVLLHRYTGQDDILVGSSIANRNHVETEGLIGLLINTLILRSDLSGDPTFEGLLERVREMSLGAYTHQDLPFEQLLDELRAEWDAGNAPVFQVAFQLQNFVMPTLELRSLRLSPFAIEVGTAKFDLSLSMIETPEELIASLEYNTDLFEDVTVTRMLEHYRILLESIVADPSLRISDLPLLGESERGQLLSEWNPHFESASPSVCLHQMFEEQVKRTPNAVALVFEDQRLTYDELNRRANQLVHYLSAMGVGAEALVAMCVERSVEMVVGILGILKAGGAYVPLDPVYPKERLAFMLEDTQAQFLLTQQSLAGVFAEHAGRRVLLDTDWPEIANASEENANSKATADTLAYVIYTSGSTGKPKGTLVTHSNVARLFEATQANFQFDEQDVWTLFHSYAFDFSVWEIWGALLYGGRLVIVPYWVARSAEAFHRLLGSEQVTVLNQTPSAFRQLMHVDEVGQTFQSVGDNQEESQTQDLKLRLVIFGGEALELQSLKPWFAKHGDRLPQLVNMFGITETTVHVTYRPLAQADLDLASTSHSNSVIGRPLSCLQVYLLDHHGQLVPVGVPGEICVGGSGVTRGYLNRPELTAARFIPHPFSTEAGARLYRSGDLGRYLADGDIEYLGRIDSQVKVRGFRIELGEIESALAEHPAVRECTVIARDETDEKKLVAYLVADWQPAPSTTDLREFLHEKLPEHMIPAAFVELDALPLTPNGKIDRRALPALDQARPQLGKGFVAPRTPVEKELAAIWRELLGVAEVGIYDDFFELGGHSLLLTQLASWVRKDFQVEVPLRVLFDTPTIIEMTKAILARQVEQENKTDLAQMLDQLKQLSPHEVQAMLAKMGSAR